jgi:hypothetical protein
VKGAEPELARAASSALGAPSPLASSPGGVRPSSDYGKLTNDEDNILGEHGDESGSLVTLTGSATGGFVGTIAVGVDPAAIASESGSDGAAGGRPPDGDGGPDATATVVTG